MFDFNPTDSEGVVKLFKFVHSTLFPSSRRHVGEESRVIFYHPPKTADGHDITTNERGSGHSVVQGCNEPCLRVETSYPMATTKHAMFILVLLVGIKKSINNARGRTVHAACMRVGEFDDDGDVT